MENQDAQASLNSARGISKYRVNRILSFDSGFDGFPGIARLSFQPANAFSSKLHDRQPGD
jgi:hypothetical protein